MYVIATCIAICYFLYMLENSKNIGKQIKEIRDLHNLSQNRFAKKLGLSPKSISAYETNRTIPPLKVLEKISDIYNVSLIRIPKKTKNNLYSKIETFEENLNEIKDLINKGLSF